MTTCKAEACPEKAARDTTAGTHKSCLPLERRLGVNIVLQPCRVAIRTELQSIRVLGQTHDIGFWLKLSRVTISGLGSCRRVLYLVR